MESGEPVIMRNREGCAGGGKGPMFSERSFTLATSNDQIVFYGNRVDDIRIQGDVINTLQARMGTGGGNVPMVFKDEETNQALFEPKSAFEENWAESKVKNALRANASKSSHAVVFPIQDGREIEKSQNGLGVGEENDPAYTLDRTGAQAVAIQGNMIGRADTAGPQGKGFTEEGEPMFTLTKTDVHAVASSTVRRLTPMECERLQGFPDGWTKFDAEGNEVTDGHRYKQMGNAVAVPVVSWIVNRLMGAANDMD